MNKECNHIAEIPQLNGTVTCTECGKWFSSEAHINDVIKLQSQLTQAQQTIEELRKKITALQSQLQASEWVSVEDGLPEEGQIVDVWADGKRFTDLIFENGDFGTAEESIDLDEITRGSDYITKIVAKYELKVSYWKPITPPTE